MDRKLCPRIHPPPPSPLKFSPPLSGKVPPSIQKFFAAFGHFNKDEPSMLFVESDLLIILAERVLSLHFNIKGQLVKQFLYV